MCDEMAIRQLTTWVPSEERYVGYVDLGGELTTDTDKIAKNALVLMAVGLKKRWKAPISFHFTAGINAETLSVLLKQSINALHEIGIQTKCIVTDGLRTNIAALNNLGCNFENRKFFFTSESGKDIPCMMDQVHMMKVLRNLWGDIKIIKGPHGEAKWSHVEGLIKLQVGNVV